MAWWDGFYQWATGIIKPAITTVVNPADTEETDSTTTEYETVTTYSEPLRTTKCLFVPEMSDFFTDEELNSGYHSKEEYDNAIKNFGLIYKAQKFSNADTVDKLLDYATDYVKNNFHGGLTSFTITALDKHLLGEMNKRKYMSGDRVRVIYPDPMTHTDIERDLTIISADYDLYNPENNSYKVGIPDTTLNKVYGDTSKSGSGGGSGSATSSETDAGDDTTMNELVDGADEQIRGLDERLWATWFRSDNPDIGLLQTPQEKNPGGTNFYGLTTDMFKSGSMEATLIEAANSIKSKFGIFSGNVQAKQVNTDKVASQDAEISSGEITIGEKVYAPNVVNNRPTVSIDGSPFTLMNDNNGEFKLGSKTFGLDLEDGKPTITINGQKYTLKTEE